MEGQLQAKLDAHQRGACKPCAYYWQKADGCRNGDSCDYCHLCGTADLKKYKLIRRRQLKQADRMGMVQHQRRGFSETMSTASTTDSGGCSDVGTSASVTGSNQSNKSVVLLQLATGLALPPHERVGGAFGTAAAIPSMPTQPRGWAKEKQPQQSRAHDPSQHGQSSDPTPSPEVAALRPSPEAKIRPQTLQQRLAGDDDQATTPWTRSGVGPSPSPKEQQNRLANDDVAQPWSNLAPDLSQAPPTSGATVSPLEVRGSPAFLTFGVVEPASQRGPSDEGVDGSDREHMEYIIRMATAAKKAAWTAAETVVQQIDLSRKAGGPGMVDELAADTIRQELYSIARSVERQAVLIIGKVLQAETSSCMAAADWRHQLAASGGSLVL